MLRLSRPDIQVKFVGREGNAGHRGDRSSKREQKEGEEEKPAIYELFIMDTEEWI